MYKTLQLFSAFCARDIRAVALTHHVSDTVHRALLSTAPDVVVATPTTAWNNANTSALELHSVLHVVIDEADLVLPCGYLDDVRNLWSLLPSQAQVVMMSATMTEDTGTLMNMLHRNFTTLHVKEADTERLAQFVLRYVGSAKDYHLNQTDSN